MIYCDLKKELTHCLFWYKPKWLMSLREEREAKGISQADFADMLGVHNTSMCRLEHKPLNRNQKQWLRIAELLGTTIEKLWTPDPVCQKPANDSQGNGGHEPHRPSKVVPLNKTFGIDDVIQRVKPNGDKKCNRKIPEVCR